MQFPEAAALEQNEREVNALLYDADYKEMLGAYGKVQYLYEAGIDFVRGRLEALNNEFRVRHSHNPIHHIQSRVKTPQSISRKLKKSGIPVSMTNAKKNLRDIAGVRVICSFQSDIYMLADALLKQDDITLLKRKDYIAHPKENGYRSLHLIVQIPIYLHDQKKLMKVEVQFRTISMDWWASLEHKIRYKKDVIITPEIEKELRECAEISDVLDRRMEMIQQKVESGYQ